MISFFPAMMPACGPPKSLSPLNITTETPASMLCFTVAALTQGHELFKRRLVRKTGDLEIRRMYAQQNPRFFIDGLLVVREVRAIRRADLAKDCPALLHDFRDSKAVPDFDQFPARDNHFAAASQRRKRHQHRRRTIVHHN